MELISSEKSGTEARDINERIVYAIWWSWTQFYRSRAGDFPSFLFSLQMTGPGQRKAWLGVLTALFAVENLDRFSAPTSPRITTMHYVHVTNDPF